MRRAFIYLWLAAGVACFEPTNPGRPARGGSEMGGTGSGSRSLAFTIPPRTILAGEAMPTVEVVARRGSGGPDTSFVGSITLSIGANPGGGALSGATRASAAAGVARFGGLTINRPGVGYTLIATASGAGSATSARFNVSDPTPLSITMSP